MEWEINRNDEKRPKKREKNQNEMKSNQMKTIRKWITLSPEHRDTSDIGRNAFKINKVWFAANKLTMGTFFIMNIKRERLFVPMTNN